MNFTWPIPADLIPTGALPAGLAFGANRTTTATPHAHAGVDLAWGNPGAPVLAAAAGAVKVAKAISTLGGPAIVYIDHGDGWQTRYMHLDPALDVKVGDLVLAGDEIGVIGKLASGPHVHFEVRRDVSSAVPNGVAVDPMTVLGAAGGLFAVLLVATVAYYVMR